MEAGGATLTPGGSTCAWVCRLSRRCLWPSGTRPSAALSINASLRPWFNLTLTLTLTLIGLFEALVQRSRYPSNFQGWDTSEVDQDEFERCAKYLPIRERDPFLWQAGEALLLS